MLARIGARLSVPESRELRELVIASHAEADATLFRLLSALLPHLSPQELRYRMLLMYQMTVTVATGALDEQLSVMGEEPVSPTDVEGRLVAYLIGAFSAPASDRG